MEFTFPTLGFLREPSLLEGFSRAFTGRPEQDGRFSPSLDERESKKFELNAMTTWL